MLSPETAVVEWLRFELPTVSREREENHCNSMELRGNG